jgi:hypothetical protein
LNCVFLLKVIDLSPDVESGRAPARDMRPDRSVDLAHSPWNLSVNVTRALFSGG